MSLLQAMSGETQYFFYMPIILKREVENLISVIDSQKMVTSFAYPTFIAIILILQFLGYFVGQRSLKGVQT